MFDIIIIVIFVAWIAGVIFGGLGRVVYAGYRNASGKSTDLDGDELFVFVLFTWPVIIVFSVVASIVALPFIGLYYLGKLIYKISSKFKGAPNV